MCLALPLLAAKCFLPTESYLRLAAFVVPFLIVGYDVLLDAAVNAFHGEVFDEKVSDVACNDRHVCSRTIPGSSACNAVESFSSHPIAKSVIRAHGGHIDKRRSANPRELIGPGVCADIDEKAVYAGNGRLLDKEGAHWHECHIAGTVLHVCIENEYVGRIVISDEVKEYAKQAITDLKQLSVTNIVMLTGDSEAAASTVATELGIDEYHAQLLPEGKVDAVENLLTQTEGLHLWATE